jgi:ankyrin repeat protein
MAAKGNLAVVKPLLKKLSNPKVRNFTFGMATLNDNPKLLQYRVDQEANSDEALIIASIHGRTFNVEFLLELGARSDTALKLVSFYGHRDVVRLLLRKGALINSNLLSLSTVNPKNGIFQLRVQAGADLSSLTSLERELVGL